MSLAGLPVVDAVCVTFRPDRDRLNRVIQSIRPQVRRVLLVDNSAKASEGAYVRELASASQIDYLPMNDNLGLAKALNLGIQRAISSGCTHVLLLDQDSVAAPDMVSALLEGQRQAATHGPMPIAALGPLYEDERLGVARHVRFLRFPPRRVLPISEPDVFRVDMLISSGSLIPLEAFDAIGFMNELLFIDHVDTDWCLRASELGWQLLVVKRAHMTHRLGERSAILFGRRLPLHGPERLYYIFRNSVRLYTRPYAPWPWIVADLRRLLVVFLLHALYGRPRSRSVRRMICGILDGARTSGGHRTQVK